MITLNPAKLLKLDKKMGSLKVGKDADIVIWSDEPLSIYAKVESTFVDGRLLLDHNYNEKLMSRDQKEKARIISKMATSRGKKQKIKFEKEDKTLKLNEILALGPSISVLMEGYQTQKFNPLDSIFLESPVDITLLMTTEDDEL